jgi:hypothetical protein
MTNEATEQTVWGSLQTLNGASTDTTDTDWLDEEETQEPDIPVSPVTPDQVPVPAVDVEPSTPDPAQTPLVVAPEYMNPALATTAPAYVPVQPVPSPVPPVVQESVSRDVPETQTPKRRGGRTKAAKTVAREQRVYEILRSSPAPMSKMQVVGALPSETNPQMIYLALRVLREQGKVRNYRNEQSAWVWEVTED